MRTRAGGMLAGSIWLAAALGGLFFPSGEVAADEVEVPDAVAAAPRVYSTLHEDERVRVVEMRLAPGATDGLHRHPHEVVYFLSGGEARVELPDGQALDIRIPDGGVLSHEPWMHTVTNVGGTEIHGVIVELADEPGSRPAVADGTDAVAVAPDCYQMIHEDERARVLLMTLPAGTTDGEHSHPDEVAYFVSGGVVRIHAADGVLEVDLADGQVLSHEAWTHTVENAGDSEIRAVVWELR